MTEQIKDMIDRDAIAGDPLAGTDVAVGGIEASDVFGLCTLDADFKVQTSSIDDQKTRASAKNELGDEAATATHDLKATATATYIYVGTGTVLGLAPGSIPLISAVAGTFNVGLVSNGYAIDSIAIAYTNNTWPTLTITGHNHTSNAHADADMEHFTASLNFPSGFGCVSLLADTGAADSCVSTTYTLTAEHVDVLGATGEHLAGNYKGGSETIASTFYGVPTLDSTGWVLTSDTAADSNADFDQVNITASKAVSRD
jgi:hypothetical protein